MKIVNGLQKNEHNIMRCLEFIWFRALAETRAGNSRSFLGIAWWIIEPMLYLGAFYVVFGLVFKRGGENFVSFLLCGLVVWKWFASSVQNASMAIQYNMKIIYQVYLPKIVFPAVALVVSTLRFSLVFIILLVFLIINDIPVTLAWLIDLPLLLFLQIALMMGLAMIFSAIVPLIPDLKIVIDNGMILLFFLSGIFFRFDAVPETLRSYFNLNPMAVLIRSYREVLIAGQHLNWLSLMPVVGMVFGLLLIGCVLLWRWDRRYAKRAFL
jgi:lipopolysaccharide transport system permease protein